MSGTASRLLDVDLGAVVRKLPADIGFRVAERFGADVVAAPAEADLARRFYALSAPANPQEISAALRGGAFHVVEVLSDGTCFGEWAGVPADDCGFLVSMTAATAYHGQFETVIVNELARRLHIEADRRFAIELCLHEAILNAVVHGNAEMPSLTGDGLNEYVALGEMTVARMADPHYGNRRVDILASWREQLLYLGVADEGNGFDVANYQQRPDVVMRKGRGFVFMRQFADTVYVNDCGRCTLFEFALDPDEL